MTAIDPPRNPADAAELEAARKRIDELERERLQLLDEAARLQADAMNLVARASHEIRTPLNGVLGLVELAGRLCTSDVQRRHLEMAAESGRALTLVLNDVLDLASLSGMRGVDPADSVDLDLLFTEALRSITPQLGWGDCSVVYDYDSDVDRVRAHAGRLRQVVINLLGNAAKWTERGHIGLSASVRQRQGRRCELRLRIEDTGPGIAADALPRLFEPFAVTGHAPQRGGSGLGLSIVKGIVDAMHGDISIASAVGRGTTVDVRLDLDVEATAEPRPVTDGGRAWLVYSPPYVEGGVRLRQRLARLGWHAEVLDSIQIAQRRAADEAPDVAIVAAHSVSSVGDVEHLVAALPHARVVLVSRADWVHPEIEQRALDLGLSCLLVPVSHRDLLGIVEPARRQPAPPAPPARPHGIGASRLEGRVLLVDDDDVNRLIGEHVLAAMGLAVQCVPSGEAALDACARTPPDLVLMDIQMQGMDGIEACRRLREAQRQGHLPHFPIVGLTADSTPTTADAGRRAGMVGVMTKPCEPRTLYDALSEHLPPARAA
jgi:CheY-like chemotaxis protein